MVYDPNKPDEEQDEQAVSATEAQPPASGAQMRTTGSIAGPTSVATPPEAQTMAATSTPAPQGSAASPDLMQYAAQWMANPSRFDNEMVQQGMQAVNAEAERGKDEASKALDEKMASRGLVGSSIEGDATAKMLSQIEDDRLRRMWEINVTQAQTQAADRQAAGQFALGVQGQSGSQALQQRALDLQAQGMSQAEALERARMEQQGSQFGQSLQLQRDSLTGSQGLQERALALQAQGMSMQDALARAQMEQQSGQFGQSIGLQREALLGSQNLQQQDINLRAEQLQQQAAQAGRALSLEEARLQASTELSREQMAQQGSQFGQSLEQRQQEFAAQHGLDVEQLRVQQEQFGASLAEQIAGREQQGSQFSAGLEQDERFRQFAADAQMRGLDLAEAEQQWREQYGTRQQDLDYLQTLINMFGAGNIDGADQEAILAMLNGETGGGIGGWDNGEGNQEGGTGGVGNGIEPNVQPEVWGNDATMGGGPIADWRRMQQPTGTQAAPTSQIAPDDLLEMFRRMQALGGA